jgi:hypothetical protein
MSFIDDFTKRVHKKFAEEKDKKLKELFCLKFGRDFNDVNDLPYLTKVCRPDGDVYEFKGVEFAFIGVSDFINSGNSIKQIFTFRAL